MSLASVAAAYKLDLSAAIPPWLASGIHARFGRHPFMMLALLAAFVGAVVAAALPLTEASVLLYNTTTKVEVKLSEAAGLTREVSNRPGHAWPWVHGCDGAFEAEPAELRELRKRRRAQHGWLLAAAALVVAALAARGGGFGPAAAGEPRVGYV